MSIYDMFLEVCELNINVDNCVTEVMLFRLSYFMSIYFLFQNITISACFYVLGLT